VAARQKTLLRRKLFRRRGMAACVCLGLHFRALPAGDDYPFIRVGLRPQGFAGSFQPTTFLLLNCAADSTHLWSSPVDASAARHSCKRQKLRYLSIQDNRRRWWHIIVQKAKTHGHRCGTRDAFLGGCLRSAKIIDRHVILHDTPPWTL
jgi:hypothetical protein